LVKNIKETVQEIYNKNINYNEPEQAINQAESLKSLSTDLYTDAKRFIYELLQNADDSACDGNNVDVCIKLHDNTLVLAHTGKPFTSRDIIGLCSINNGTKKSDISKTGFKGIGFKSVFGQSDNVIVYSDKEYFKFDATYDFEWKKNWIEEGYESQKSWEEKNEREFFYPWQIIPIYIESEDVNQELDSEIIKFLSSEKWNVATIIKVSKTEEIVKAIEELLSNVNMFLFLKGINSIKFEFGTVTTIISIDKNHNELVLKKDVDVVSRWITNTVQLSITTELKDILQNDSNIPKKLKVANNIELTLAIRKNEHGLEELSQNENLLYAYLPTDEKRYALPVLVNTTFLTSANRESLHIDSKWNQWLFKSISIELFKWIARLVKKEYSYQAYELIPSKLKVYDDLSNAYNCGINEAIESLPFILSKENKLLKVNEALIDETSLSNKVFIGSEIIRDFMKYKIGDENKIVEKPFIYSVPQLKKIGVADFSWSDIPAFFAFENFVSEHTVEKNIQLIEYFRNEFQITNSSFPKEKLKNWAFLYDHKNKLNYPNNIYFPTPDDTTWNNPESELSFLHKEIQLALINKQSVRVWLEQLGVIEKTDISFLVKTIIPNASSYISSDNTIKTIQTIYNLYKKENINCYLEQLSRLLVLTTNDNLCAASEIYFSDNYNPRLKLETILSDCNFLSEKYLLLDDNKDELRLFFKKIGVQECIEPIVVGEKKNKNILIQEYNFQNEYFLEADKKFQPFSSIFTADEYENIIYIRFLNKTETYDFSKIFWKDLISNCDITIFNNLAQVFWGNRGYPGRNTGNSVENYPKWYIKNNQCIPTTKGICEKSKNVFLNTDEIKSIGDKYLPIFDGIELNQDWRVFFQFKTQLVLDDYLELLNSIMNDKNDEGKIKNDNQKRVQLIIKTLLDLSINWGADEIEKISSWASSAYLIDEDGYIILCSELRYYKDGDNSIFQNLHKFIALNEENKTHKNIETFLGYLGIVVLRQDSFNIIYNGEKVESDLKYKLKEIFPFLIKWIQKIDKQSDSIILKDKLDTLQIDEVSKLSLSYDGAILKSVKTHLEKDKLLVTTPWNSNASMLELPRVLCEYFEMKGYEDKLAFLLNIDNELEIREYFENENIELPIELINNDVEEKVTRAIAKKSNITKEEYYSISNSFKHISDSSIEKRKYIETLLPRAKKRVIEHLSVLDEYDCTNVDNSALTVLSGIKKYGNEIYVIPRPSDGGKVIIYFPSELDALEYADSELWYEDGVSIPKKLTFGKVLRDAKINKIPIRETKEEKVINLLNNFTNEDIAYEPILPSSFDIAKAMASLANTNGGYLIIGCSKEKQIIGIHSDFNTTQLIQNAIKYSNYFVELLFEEIKINEKTLFVVKIEKSNMEVVIENKKYIRISSIIKEEQKNNNKPLIITEGKTDWKHLKKSLERFQKEGLYTNLDIQFEEYEDMNMGDGELDRMVQTYSKTEQSKKYIFMFDRDNKTFVKKYANERFNNHGNNVYSFCIPKISNELDNICIEFYYKEEDLTTEDESGSRIFIGKDFLPNGNSKCGKYVTEKRKAIELDILDRDKKVYLRDDIKWENNIALSKNDFTNNIINERKGFNSFDIDNFKLIFDVIEEIVNDNQ
jgi:hypothetical protein